MKAIVLEKQQYLEENPLRLKDVPTPEPKDDEIRININICGACRTDLHIVEGELPAHKMPVIIGHQIVGRVDKLGKSVSKWKLGDRVGVPWLYKTCGKCKYCKSGKENLCDNAMFTGYDANGGFAQYTVISQDFAYQLPENYSDLEVAPLLCAGVIGYQAFQATGLKNEGRLGLFGFGSSAHIIIQVAIHLGLEVYVVSRTQKELDLAKNLGAKWVGHINDDMETVLDAGIVFAPSGELLIQSLEKLDKGGRIVSAGIYTTPLPGFDYSLIYPEKCLTSIAHTTRQNVSSFLKVASEFKIKTQINKYELKDAQLALLNIKNSKISGSTVLIIQ
ncbi:zinc-binding alcohol dehydrogenase family protein [candidate division WOR-3 bacterium]|jgi:propanol-preferring alcohol dehydrogenase|nr:zinc-binding alcohol dehydrogenase family protein [candidate division WOR-3 bacterium]